MDPTQCENHTIYSESDNGSGRGVARSREGSSSVGPTGTGRPPRGQTENRVYRGEGKKWSPCWDHFEEYEAPNKKKRARCKHCGTSYACDPNVNGTRNLNEHIENRCKVLLSKRTENDSTQKTLVQSRQKTLEGYATTLSTHSFSKEDCRRALAEMIIVDELPFRFVENPGFQKFCKVMCPRFDVPSRRTIVRDLYQLYVDEKSLLMKRIKESKLRMSLTTDTWTSIQNMNYMVITAHFIGEEWVLQKRILSFSLISDHKGESIGKCIEAILLEWGIDRVFTITVDNATANTTAVSYITRKLNSWHRDGTILGGKYVHVRCNAHILNLIVSDGLRDMNDSVASIRNAVKYVKSSPSRFARFKKCVEHEKLKCKGLVVLDVATRWNSTYLMLDSAIKLRKAFERMEEEDGHYMNYFRESEYGRPRIGPPSADHWENASVLSKFLMTFYDVTLDFSASLKVTSNTYFLSWVTIYNKLTSLSGERDDLVRTIATSMRFKFDKYWGSLETTNNLLMVACVFDPRYKFGYMKFRLESFFGVEKTKEMISKIRSLLDELYDTYKSLNPTLNSSGGGTSSNNMDGGSGLESQSEDKLPKSQSEEELLWEKRQMEENENYDAMEQMMWNY